MILLAHEIGSLDGSVRMELVSEVLGDVESERVDHDHHDEKGVHELVHVVEDRLYCFSKHSRKEIAQQHPERVEQLVVQISQQDEDEAEELELDSGLGEDELKDFEHKNVLGDFLIMTGDHLLFEEFLVEEKPVNQVSD